MTDELRAPGGFCAPIADAYALSNQDRPVRDALVRMFDLAYKRMRLPEDERIAFDIEHYGRSLSGCPDVTAELCETRISDDWDEQEYEVTGHRWDSPFRMGGR